MRWIRGHSWKSWAAVVLYIAITLGFFHLLLRAGTHDEPRTGGPTTTTLAAPVPFTINMPPVTVVPGPGKDTKEVIQQPTVKIIREDDTTTTTAPTTTTTGRPTTTSSSTTSTTRFGCIVSNPVTC